MEKGVALPTRTIVIVVLLILVLAMLAYFFIITGGNVMNPVIDESSINKECGEWKHHWYSYSEFNSTNYPVLVENFGNPVRASKYCQDMNADIDIVGDCSNDKCGSGTPPSWASKCCCEDEDGDGACGDEETNCGWGTYC